MAELIRVSAQSRSTAVAGAIAGVMREQEHAEMQAIGASAVNQAIKAVAIARGYLEQDGIDLVIVPTFTEVDIEGNERTAVRIAIYRRPQSLKSTNGFFNGNGIATASLVMA
ncbi:MAG: stage V sporulation protein S [Caldilinea sp. CFX5]|nr:stage V sporulation protein S [Caldilinea sp. CFX5]